MERFNERVGDGYENLRDIKKIWVKSFFSFIFIIICHNLYELWTQILFSTLPILERFPTLSIF